MSQKVLYVLVVLTFLLTAYNTFLLHGGLEVTFPDAPKIETY